jgi:hypothetical protein
MRSAPALGAQPPPYEVRDSTAVVTRHAQRRGDGWRVGQAALGWSKRLGGYEGLPLLTAGTPAGVITGSGCAPAATAEQRLAETWLAARSCPPPRRPEVGHPLGGASSLADTTVAGTRWGPPGRQDSGAVVLRCPPNRHQPWPQPWPRRLRRQVAGLRAIVETVYDQLLSTCRLARERPHTLAGLRARLAATVTLPNCCCWLNQHLGRPLLAFAALLDW